MTKRFLLILSVIGILGLGLIGIGALLNSAPPASGGSNAEHLEPAMELNDARGKTAGFLELDAFDSIELSVKSADILFQQGSDYSITFDLHDKEPVKQAEVVDGTLYFSTGLDPSWKVDRGDWEVIITVPASASLEHLALSTVAGDIILADLTFDSGILSSTAGKLNLSGLVCDKLELASVSESIHVQNSRIKELAAENKVTEIQLDGTFDRVTLDSVSGSCILSGTLTDRAALKTVSGKIQVTVPASAVTAESWGTIQLNGASQGHKLELTGSGPALVLKSISGDIELNTQP